MSFLWPVNSVVYLSTTAIKPPPDTKQPKPPCLCVYNVYLRLWLTKIKDTKGKKISLSRSPLPIHITHIQYKRFFIFRISSHLEMLSIFCAVLAKISHWKKQQNNRKTAAGINRTAVSTATRCSSILLCPHHHLVT